MSSRSPPIHNRSVYGGGEIEDPCAVSDRASVIGDHVWSDVSTRTIPPIGVSGSGGEPFGRRGALSSKFVDWGLDREKARGEQTPASRRGGIGPRSGELLSSFEIHANVRFPRVPE